MKLSRCIKAILVLRRLTHMACTINTCGTSVTTTWKVRELLFTNKGEHRS